MPSRLCHHAALSNRNRRIGGGSEGGRKTLTFLLCSLPCALYVLILIFDCLSFFPSCFLFVLCVFVFALGFVSFVSLFCGGWSRPLFVQGFKAESMVGKSRFVESGASSPLNSQQIVPPPAFVESEDWREGLRWTFLPASWFFVLFFLFCSFDFWFLNWLFMLFWLLTFDVWCLSFFSSFVGERGRKVRGRRDVLEGGRKEGREETTGCRLFLFGC